MIFIVLVLILSIRSAHAQEVVEVSPLYFGTMVILDNSSAGTIEVDELGNTTVSTNFAVVDPPTYGEYQLVGFASNATLFVTTGIVQAQTTTDTHSDEQFTLTAVNVVNSINVDSDGNADFRVGGTLQTSGSGSLNYGDQTYTCRLIITVDY